MENFKNCEEIILTGMASTTSTTPTPDAASTMTPSISLTTIASTTVTLGMLAIPYSITLLFE